MVKLTQIAKSSPGASDRDAFLDFANLLSQMMIKYYMFLKIPVVVRSFLSLFYSNVGRNPSLTGLQRNSRGACFSLGTGKRSHYKANTCNMVSTFGNLTALLGRGAILQTQKQ